MKAALRVPTARAITVPVVNVVSANAIRRALHLFGEIKPAIQAAPAAVQAAPAAVQAAPAAVQAAQAAVQAAPAAVPELLIQAPAIRVAVVLQLMTARLRRVHWKV